MDLMKNFKVFHVEGDCACHQLVTAAVQVHSVSERFLAMPITSVLFAVMYSPLLSQNVWPCISFSEAILVMSGPMKGFDGHMLCSKFIIHLFSVAQTLRTD